MGLITPLPEREGLGVGRDAESARPSIHPPPTPPFQGGEFGARAARLAGFCAVVLGWTPDQFWRATPAEVRGVVDVLTPQGEAPVTRGMLDELEKSCG